MFQQTHTEKKTIKKPKKGSKKKMSMWSSIWGYVFAHGYVRLPLCIIPPLMWNWYGCEWWERQFQSWNKGHNQIDVWLRIKEKVDKMEPEEPAE